MTHPITFNVDDTATLLDGFVPCVSPDCPEAHPPTSGAAGEAASDLRYPVPRWYGVASYPTTRTDNDHPR